MTSFRMEYRFLALPSPNIVLFFSYEIFWGEEMMTFEQLYVNGYTEVPLECGVYVVKVPDNFKVQILDTTTAITEYNGRNLLYDAMMLREKYDQVIEKDILYYGKANRNGGLKARVKEFARYGYCEANNHRGGRAIWQIQNNKQLLIEFMPCENAEAEEQRLLNEYRLRNNTFPLANWKL